MTKKNMSRPRLRVLATEDPNSMFHHFSPQEILEKLGPPRTLLSRSVKSDKSEKVQVHSKVLFLTSGLLCPKADTCRAVCLGHVSGRMTMLQSANARDRRTAQYLVDPEHFLSLLRADLRVLEHEARTANMLAAARLNGSSDLPWEQLHPELFEEFNDRITFYDYTRLYPRMMAFLKNGKRCPSFPKNYHLTFSQSETNGSDAERVLAAGGNVAVVFWPDVPKRWNGRHVIDGDEHDARFLDKPGRIVGLSAKGIARADLSGFVVRTTDASVTSKRKSVA